MRVILQRSAPRRIVHCHLCTASCRKHTTSGHETGDATQSTLVRAHTLVHSARHFGYLICHVLCHPASFLESAVGSTTCLLWLLNRESARRAFRISICSSRSVLCADHASLSLRLVTMMTYISSSPLISPHLLPSAPLCLGICDGVHCTVSLESSLCNPVYATQLETWHVTGHGFPLSLRRHNPIQTINLEPTS